MVNQEDMASVKFGKKGVEPPHLLGMIKIAMCKHCSKMAFPILQTVVEYGSGMKISGQSASAGYFCPETMTPITPMWAYVQATIGRS